VIIFNACYIYLAMNETQ